MSCAATFDYCIVQGDAWDVSLIYKQNDVPVDLTAGYSARFAVVWGKTDDDEYAITDQDIENPIELGSEGQIRLRVPSEVTALFPITKDGLAVAKRPVRYQVSLDPDGGDDDRHTILLGTVEVHYSAIEDADDTDA